MTEIKELLAKLKKRDPKTEEEYSRLDRQLPLNIDPKIRYAVLQLVVQEAIMAAYIAALEAEHGRR